MDSPKWCHVGSSKASRFEYFFFFFIGSRFDSFEVVDFTFKEERKREGSFKGSCVLNKRSTTSSMSPLPPQTLDSRSHLPDTRKL